MAGLGLERPEDEGIASLARDDFGAVEYPVHSFGAFQA